MWGGGLAMGNPLGDKSSVCWSPFLLGKGVRGGNNKKFKMKILKKTNQTELFSQFH